VVVDIGLSDLHLSIPTIQNPESIIRGIEKRNMFIKMCCGSDRREKEYVGLQVTRTNWSI
jgi:hypothetical protein